MGSVVYGVPIGRARQYDGTAPSMPVISVNGVIPDRFGRVRIPGMTQGSGAPATVSGRIIGDQYLDTVSMQVWHVVVDSVQGLVWQKQKFSPLSGRAFDLSNTDGIAEAAGTAVEELGGTVS